MGFNPIKDKKVYEQIIDQVKEMIFTGQLKKGDKLPSERVLTEELGVSRASIREAFSALEMIGLIESRHGEGTFVRENTDENFLKPLPLLFMLEEQAEVELIELRKVLEISCARYAAVRASGEEIVEIGKYVTTLEANLGNAEVSLQADRNFHYAIARATGNRLLYKLLNSISEVIDLTIAQAIKQIGTDAERTATLIGQHRKIYEAIAQRDATLAGQAMEEHLVWAEYLNEGDK